MGEQVNLMIINNRVFAHLFRKASDDDRVDAALKPLQIVCSAAAVSVAALGRRQRSSSSLRAQLNTSE